MTTTKRRDLVVEWNPKTMLTHLDDQLVGEYNLMAIMMVLAATSMKMHYLLWSGLLLGFMHMAYTAGMPNRGIMDIIQTNITIVFAMTQIYLMLMQDYQSRFEQVSLK